MAKYALVVGITHYDYNYNFPNLIKPATDAEAIAQILDKQGEFQKIIRLPEAWNQGLGAPEVAAGRVSSEDLQNALQTFLAEADKGEALIYFSGHGLVVPDGLNKHKNVKKGYLATSDSTIETIAAHGIPFDSFNELIRDSNLSSLVVILDCCHAGSFLERDLVEQTLTAFGSQKDYYLIAACRTTEKAYEGESDRAHSIFTEALLEGLSGDKADEEGQISCDRLFDYIRKSQRLKNFGQQPIRLGLGGSIPLVNYIITVKEPISLNRENPYQGLHPFTQEQAKYFKGRDRAIRDLLVRLNQDRFLAVIGPSGCGKSSLIKAGLLPELMRDRLPGSSHWEIETFSPGKHPLMLLQEIFLRQHRHTHNYVLFIDQFEEVFTLCENEEERRTFLQLISEEATTLERLARVIVAVRGDFLDRCAAYKEIAQLINNTEPRTYIVPPLTLAELEAAIEKPATDHGVEFEPGLVSLIAEDIQDQPGALPLLQYALRELWRICVKQSDLAQPILTEKAYQEIGGVKGALNETANNLYKTRSEEDQVFIRNLLMQLVQIEEDKESRRPISWERVNAIADSPEQCQRVIGLLADQRLIVTDEKQIQVAHEALLFEWKVLRDWIAENRENIRLSRRLELSCREWQERFNESSEALLQNPWLALIENWVKTAQPRLPEIEFEYLKQSIQERDRQLQAELEQERQLREFAEAKARMEAEKAEQERAKAIAEMEKAIEAEKRAEAEAEKTQQIQLRLKAEKQRNVSLSVAACVLATLAVLAVISERRANDYKEKAINALLSGPKELLDKNNQLEAAMASLKALQQLESIRGNHKMAVKKLWKTVISQIKEHNRFEGHKAAVVSLSFNPERQWLASASADGVVKLWYPDGSKAREDLNIGKDVVIWSVAFSNDNQFLVTGNGDGNIRIFNLSKEREPEVLKCPSQDPRVASDVTDVCFSHDSQTLVSGHADGTIKTWRKAPNGLFGPNYDSITQDSSAPVSGVTCSSKDDSIASSHSDGSIKLWKFEGSLLTEIKTFNEPKLPHPPFMAHKVRFNHRGTQIASAHGDGTIKIWNVDQEPGDPWKTLTYKEEKDLAFYTVAFSPKDEMIAAGSGDRSIKVWDLESLHSNLNKSEDFNGHDAQVLDVTLIQNGELLVSASADKTVRVWETKLFTDNLNKITEKSGISEIKDKECERFKDYIDTNETGKENKKICD